MARRDELEEARKVSRQEYFKQREAKKLKRFREGLEDDKKHVPKVTILRSWQLLMMMMQGQLLPTIISVAAVDHLQFLLDIRLLLASQMAYLGFEVLSPESWVVCNGHHTETWMANFSAYANSMGRLLTGATLSLLIGGGAYASTVDEATFCGWLFNATKILNPLFAFLDPEVAHRLAVSAAARRWVPREKRPDPSILGQEVWGGGGSPIL